MIMMIVIMIICSDYDDDDDVARVLIQGVTMTGSQTLTVCPG